MKCTTKLFAILIVLLSGMIAQSASPWGLQPGPVQLQSAGPITFGPEGILIVGDAQSATVFAIDTEDRQHRDAATTIDIANLNGRVSEELEIKSLVIADLAVNPLSKNIYLSAVAGGKPAIIRVTVEGEVSNVSLDKIAHAKVMLQNAPENKVVGEGRRRRNLRPESITDLAYSEGRVLVSGLSSADAPSSVSEFEFPFTENSRAASVEIYHGAHGRVEDYAAIRTFVPFNIDGKPSLLAGFTCTPLVKFPLDALAAGDKVRGTTVAELGNRNRPLDMIVYQQQGKDYLLMANSARGVMKISTENIEREDGIVEHVGGGGTAGQSYQTIESLKNVVQLDKLDDSHAVILVQNENGTSDLRSIDLP